MTERVDPQACLQFEEFYRETCDRLLARALMLVGTTRRQTAEDLMHDAYAQALRNWVQVLAGLIRQQRVAWMRTTMARMANREQQRIRRDEQDLAALAVIWQPDARESDTETRALARLTAQECLRGMQAMSALERTVAVLCFLDGYSGAQAARILDMPESTIRSAVKRARDCLAEQVGQQLPFEPRYGMRQEGGCDE